MEDKAQQDKFLHDYATRDQYDALFERQNSYFILFGIMTSLITLRQSDPQGGGDKSWLEKMPKESTKKKFP